MLYTKVFQSNYCQVTSHPSVTLLVI